VQRANAGACQRVGEVRAKGAAANDQYRRIAELGLAEFPDAGDA
jgi:hypothetical protein